MGSEINIKSAEIVKNVQVKNVSSSCILKQMQVALSCNLFCLVSGCTFGFSAVLLPQIKKDLKFHYIDSYDSWIASSSCLAMAFGSIIGGILSDKYGRRITHIVLAVPFALGWITMALATNVALLLLGRVLTGISTGVFKSLGAIFLGEITDPTNRPVFIFSLSLSGNVGVLFSHIIGGYLNWRLACFIICLPLILGLVLQVFVRESPLWLLYKGRTEKGIESFTLFRGVQERSQQELEEIKEKQKNQPPEMTFKEGLRAVFSIGFTKPLVTSFILFVTVQFSGVNTISFYAQDLLNATFSGAHDPFMLMLVTDSTRVIGISLLFAISKHIPRRKSYLAICASLVFLLICLIAYIVVKPSGLAWLAITVLMFYIALGSTLAGLSWTFIGEIFPSNLRGLASGVGSSSSFFLLFLCVNITPRITVSYGIVATYSSFAVVSAISLILLYVLLPITDGKTLQEIENSYNQK